MEIDACRKVLVENVFVDRADVADAKAYLLRLDGEVYVDGAAAKYADAAIGTPDKPLPIWQADPVPALRMFARHMSLRLAVGLTVHHLDVGWLSGVS